MTTRATTRLAPIALAAATLAAMPFAVRAEGDALADLARRQARSVHLVYDGVTDDVVAAAATVTVRESTFGSYFMAVGWDCGYCGIQELYDGRHVLIFSVWDPVDPTDLSANPDSVVHEDRARVLYADPLLDVARFGGEGSGARTMAGYSWQLGDRVRFMVKADPDGTNRTAYTCYLQDATNASNWHRLASISTMNRAGRAPGFGRLHSFVEDFRRNYESAKRVRRAEFSDVAVLCGSTGDWKMLKSARFSADKTPSNAIDAGLVPGKEGTFFLATGGSTTNANARLWSRIQ